MKKLIIIIIALMIFFTSCKYSGQNISKTESNVSSQISLNNSYISSEIISSETSSLSAVNSSVINSSIYSLNNSSTIEKDIADIFLSMSYDINAGSIKYAITGFDETGISLEMGLHYFIIWALSGDEPYDKYINNKTYEALVPVSVVNDYLEKHFNKIRYNEIGEYKINNLNYVLHSSGIGYINEHKIEDIQVLDNNRYSFKCLVYDRDENILSLTQEFVVEKNEDNFKYISLKILWKNKSYFEKMGL